MFSILMFAAALAVGPTAASADAPNAASDAIAAPIAATTPHPRTYCVVDDQVSSRIPMRTCHTREEWLARGFDPAPTRR